MKIQVALSVSEAKRLIAKAVVQLPEVKQAREKGRILLKGGTTVSAIAEELGHKPLRISGRISARGTMAAKITESDYAHSVLVERDEARRIDEDIVEVSEELGEGDVIIISGNALDINGGVAMMAGSVAGGNPGAALSAMLSEGARIVIPIGLEKLIPGTIGEAIQAAGRKGVARSFGMSTGLVPLFGKVVTEQDAVCILAEVSCTVIGRGGIMGGEGATAMVVEGSQQEVEKVWRAVEEVKGADTSGAEESLPECDGANERCRLHLACVYRRRKSR
jgi:hypothetical protein